MIDFAQRAVQTPSLSGEEKGMADLMLAELEKLGYDEVFRDDWGNVVGIVKGTEPGPVIMYNGHLDHVDTGDYSEWGGYDPYGGLIDEVEMFNEAGDAQEVTKVIHGRAASDTKCGIACQVYSGAILAQLKKEGRPMKGDYIVSAVVLEEPAEQIGMIGLMEDTFVKRGIKVDGVVSCEASDLKLVLGHRGRLEMIVEVQGITSHASNPQLGINAVYKATKLINLVEKKYPTLVKKDAEVGDSSIALTIIRCTPGAMSVVPDRCYVSFDRRLVPAETADDAIAEMQAMIDEIAAEDPDFKATVKVSAVPHTTYTGKEVTLPNIKQAWKIGKDHPLVMAAASALEGIGEPVGYTYWSFGTDLGVICGKYGMGAVGYSPMQEYYCHRPVDKCRIDFMERALVGNIAIYDKWAELPKEAFKLEQ